MPSYCLLQSKRQSSENQARDDVSAWFLQLITSTDLFFSDKLYFTTRLATGKNNCRLKDNNCRALSFFRLLIEQAITYRFIGYRCIW
jgi:hypothetical protein